MSKKGKSSNRWVSVGDLVSELLGHSDKATQDLITRHAKEPGERTKGHGSIPRRYLQQEQNPNNRKQRFTFLLSPESKVFFRNLLDLEAVLPSRMAAKVLRREHLEDPATLRRTLARSKKEMETKWRIYGNWLAHHSRLEERLLNPQVDLHHDPLLVPPGQDDRGHPAEVSQTGTPAALSFYITRRLEDLDKDTHRDLDDAGVQATKALHVLGLGEPGLAVAVVKEVLDQEPEHPHANYAFAMIHLARASASQKEAARYQVQYQEAEMRHEEMWEDMMFDAAMAARSYRKEALVRLVRALEHWPFTEWNEEKHWTDPQRRSRILEAIVEIAFEFVHAHGSVDSGDLRNILARQKGQTIGEHFGSELDPLVLKAAREAETRSPLFYPSRDSFGRKTMLLQIFFILSPDDYERLVPEWLEAFSKSPPWTMERYLTPPELTAIWPNVVREHLQRNLSTEKLKALLVELEEQGIEARKRLHESVQAFMGRTRAEEEAKIRDEDLW